jgi:hypothetical protein
LSIRDRELIDRYLTDRLTDDEVAAVEARIISDPSFRHEVEVTEALRAGLRRLDGADGIEPLLSDASTSQPARTVADRAVPVWSRPAYALAASVAAIGLGILTLLLYGQLQQERELSATLRETATVAPLAAARRQTALSFASLRSSTEPVAIRVPSEPVMYEMAFDVGAEPAAAYTLTFVRPAAHGDVVVFSAPQVAPEGDGLVRLSIHSALLAPGEYVVQIRPAAGEVAAMTDALTDAVTYQLRVVQR